MLIEGADQDRPLDEIWEGDDIKLCGLWCEDFTQQDGHFVGVYRANNQSELAVVIPDKNWVNGEQLEGLNSRSTRSGLWG